MAAAQPCVLTQPLDHRPERPRTVRRLGLTARPRTRTRAHHLHSHPPQQRQALEVAGRSSADGANVQQYACDGGAHQQW
ncbi:RICIN domain-containing protein [Streptomyces sp. GD-15H]|uniref:RICIN domain-containing protein n=1 Tax=Streptomyces sp. GD-15H TaxID=3129112 RepID=UPI003872ACFB